MKQKSDCRLPIADCRIDRKRSGVTGRQPEGKAFVNSLIPPNTGITRKFRLLLLCLLCFVVPSVIGATKLQVDLTQPGLRARSEAPIPVDVRFQWDGTAILEGRLDVELHDGNRILGHYRSGDVALTTGEQNFHMLLPPCGAPFSDSQVEVKLKFITTAGDVLEPDPSSLFLPTMNQRSLVMAWCNARTAAAAPDFEQTMMLEHFAPQSNETERKLSLTTLVRLAPEDLPAQPLSYTAFDTMVLTADAFSETTEGQLKSLARWVKGGGSVCVFVGGGLQAHHLWFLNELADSVSSGPTFLSNNNGYLVPGQKKISCLYSGMGRSVIVTGTVGKEIPSDSPDWRRAVAFLWKFREARARAIAETAHWDTVTNQSGDVPPITIEQYAAQAQSSRRPNWSVATLGTNTAGAGNTAAARQAAETRLLQSLSAGVTLTDAQKDKIKGAMSNYLDAVQQFRTTPAAQRRSKMLAARQALDTNLMGILTPDQYATYQAMRRPLGGNFMDLNLIAQDLGLTADEKSKVKLAMDEWDATLNQTFAYGPPQRQSISLTAWQTFNSKLKQVLTPEQYAKFQAGYPNRYVLPRRIMQPVMPAQPFNYGMYSRTPSYEIQPSILSSQLMPSLLPKTVRLIPFSALLGILGLFLLAIGPGDYFWLGWLRRRRYTWMLFPALSFCFMLATVLMANHFLGAHDQRRSLFVVDLDKDGTALRWNRYDVIFAAADKQVVTELKDALWVPLHSGPMSEMSYPYNPNGSYPNGMPPGTYVGNRRYVATGLNANRYNGPDYDEMESGPALYQGIVPTHFQTSQLIRQWQPRLNRVFSFEPPPVPLLPDWSEVEAAWPDLPTVRAKLSAKKRFAGDVCAISTSLYSPPYQAKTTFDPDSSQILPPSILSELCLGDSAGLLAVVSQISPNGGGSSEDVPAMDTDAGDSALVIVTQSGDDIIVYRRFFHGS